MNEEKTPRLDVENISGAVELTNRFDGTPATAGTGAVMHPITKAEKRALRKHLKAEYRKLTSDANAVRREHRICERSSKKHAGSVQKALKSRKKALDKESKAKRNARLKAKDTASFIGYERMFEDGICEVDQGLYSQSISFDDISYQAAREDRQYEVHRAWCDMLESFGTDVLVQISVVNTPLPVEEVGRRKFFDPDSQTSEAAEQAAECFNEILNEKLREGVSNIRRTRFITYSVAAPDPEEAVRELARIRSIIMSCFARIGCEGHVCTGTERLYVLNDLLRPGAPLDFDYARDISMDGSYTTKDAIAPGYIDFAPAGRTDGSCFVMDGKWCQVGVMRSISGDVSDTIVSKLIEKRMPMCISWFISPIDKTAAKRSSKLQASMIDKEIVEQQQKAAVKGYGFDVLPMELTSTKESVQMQIARLENEQMFSFSFMIYLYADDPEDLERDFVELAALASQSGMRLEEHALRQREGLNSVLPLGNDYTSSHRKLLSSDVAIFCPFACQELDEEGGNYVGQNKHSNNLVMVNRRGLASPVGFVSGKTGSGKSFAVKTEITGTLLNCPRDQIIVFDRAGEYGSLVEHFDGTEIKFGVDCETRLNPFDMSNLGGMTLDAQIAFKIDAMLAQAAASAAEAGKGLSEEEQSIISRAVEEAYVSAIERDVDAVPLLGEFYKILTDQPEPEAKMIALRYERFVRGAMSFFNNETNVSWDASIIDINIKELPDTMLVFALINMCEAVRNQMYRNFERGRRTWIYIEEIQSLFKYPTVLTYFSRFANEARKFGGFITGITQSASEMLENKDARALVMNADYIRLLKQSAVDRAKWVELLSLSKDEESCIDETCEPGGGLLIAGSAHVPIIGNFPKDNHIYKILSTDPNEVENALIDAGTDAGELGERGDEDARSAWLMRKRREARANGSVSPSGESVA